MSKGLFLISNQKRSRRLSKAGKESTTKQHRWQVETHSLLRPDLNRKANKCFHPLLVMKNTADQGRDVLILKTKVRLTLA